MDCFGEVEFWEISVAAMLTSGVAEMPSGYLGSYLSQTSTAPGVTVTLSERVIDQFMSNSKGYLHIVQGL